MLIQKQQQQQQQQSDQQYSTGFGQLDERTANSTHGTSASNETEPAVGESDVQERGFIKDLLSGPGRRSSVSGGFASMNSGCGLMRTCCRPLPSGHQHHQHHSGLQSGNGWQGQQSGSYPTRPNMMANILGMPSNSVQSIHLLKNPMSHSHTQQQQQDYRPRPSPFKSMVAGYPAGSSLYESQLDSQKNTRGMDPYQTQYNQLMDSYPMGTPCILARNAPVPSTDPKTSKTTTTTSTSTSNTDSRSSNTR